MGLALYDACEKLLNDGMTFPQKVLFSLLWMIKIVNSFTGSVLSFFHDFFGIFTGITNLALSIFPQLESYTIILNVVIEGAIFLFFHSFLINNNFLDIISNPQQLILLGFTSMFIAKSLVLSYPIKIMQSNGASEELIKLKETDNIKYSIMLELSQVALKIIGILDF